MMKKNTREEKPEDGLAPQKGPQKEFLRSDASICIYGGAAGSGKTFAVLMEPIYHLHIPHFRAVIFRRNSTMVRNPGGLWDTSLQIYSNPRLGGVPKETTLEWDFPYQSTIKFAHLQYESDVLSWQGAQIPLIIFDELTHFSKAQFFYMLSRNRSTCGVRPYIRATTNPDADSWVRSIIDWWIDPNTGIAIPHRSGLKRWFIVLNDEIIWANSKAELVEKYPDCLPKSFTFISASIFDNKKLLEADPGYLANLHALPHVERERLLNGNWNIKPSAGLYFQKGYFELVDAVPNNRNAVRYWDRAATKKTETNNPDFTVGIRLEKDINNVIYVTDMVRVQESPLGVQTIIKNTAIRDGISVRIGIEEDPGQAGVADAEHLTRMLQGFNVKRNRVMKDKITRSLPVSAQAEAGNIKILKAKWNEEFFKELENFPEGSHDDIVDALSGAFLMINENSYNVLNLSR
jgi:predicted phage terminase large subunit-like protein